MSNLRTKIFIVFHLVCICATVTFISYCLHKYSLNEDISQVTFQEFHETKGNIYPSLTICVSSIFYEDQLELYGEGINIHTYSDFLSGEHWDDRMMYIDYDNVTLNFEDYLLGIGMWTPDWRYLYGAERFFYDHSKLMNAMNGDTKITSTKMYDWKPYFYIIHRGMAQKCLSVEIPYMENKKVWTFGIVFDSEIFPEHTRPAYYEFGVKMHYPGQFLTAKMQKYVWKSRESNSSDYLTMRFKTQKLEVIKNRETAKHSCNQNWKKDDEQIMMEKITDVGCKPPHWKINSNSPRCTTQKQMKLFSEFNMTQYQPACQSIQKILYVYEEYEILEDWTDEWLNETDKIFEVMLEFQDGTYMEIQQVRDYGVQSVIGDAGGYVGLFLGFALLQIPELIFNIYYWTKNVIMNGKHSKKNHVSPQIQNDTERVTPGELGIEAIDQKIKHNCNDIEMIKRTMEDMMSKIQQHSTGMEEITSYN